MCTEHDRTTPGHPATYRILLYLLTPIELELRRAGLPIRPHFAGAPFRVKWGNRTDVPVSFAGCPTDAMTEYRRTGGSASEGDTATIPRMYYGNVSDAGLVDLDVQHARTGRTQLEIGTYEDTLPRDALWFHWQDWLDRQFASSRSSGYFRPRVVIPLMTPPTAASDAAGERFYRLWNLAQIGSDVPAGGMSSTQRGEAALIAERRWNQVRESLEGAAPPGDLDSMLADLRRHHDLAGGTSS